MSVNLIESKWSSGNLYFYEKAVGRSVTGDVLSMSTSAVTIGGTSQDIDFGWYASGSKSFVLDAGAGTLTIAGLDVSLTGDLTIDTEDINLGDADDLEFGDSQDVLMRFSTADASNHAFVLALDDTSQQMHITDKGAVATDWNRSAGTHPEIAIHSNTTPATDYLAIGNHDGTTAYIDVVGGTTLQFNIAGTGEVQITASATTPATTDSNALGSATLMWSDLFLASGAVINFNNGNATITHSTGLVTFAAGNVAFGVDGTGVDVTFFGDTASCYALWDQSEDQLKVVQTNAATSGTERAFDVSQTHTGVGASAEALRAVLTSNVALGSYGNAIFGKVDLQTTGLCAGLIGVVCGELTMPGGTIAGGAGTYAVFEAEINCPTSYNSTVPILVFSINAWGAAVGKFDDYGYLFDLTGVTSGSDHIWYDNQKAAPAVEEFIRVKTPAGVRYLALYNANA